MYDLVKSKLMPCMLPFLIRHRELSGKEYQNKKKNQESYIWHTFLKTRKNLHSADQQAYTHLRPHPCLYVFSCLAIFGLALISFIHIFGIFYTPHVDGFVLIPASPFHLQLRCQQQEIELLQELTRSRDFFFSFIRRFSLNDNMRFNASRETFFLSKHLFKMFRKRYIHRKKCFGGKYPILSPGRFFFAVEVCQFSHSLLILGL